MDRHLGVLAEHRLDLRLRLGRAELVLLGDVEHERSGELARFIQRLVDADAIIADIAIGVAARRHEIGELAAEAVADGAGLAGAGGEAAQMRQARLEIVDALGLVEALVELEGARPFRLGLVGELDAGLLPPEEIGAERDVALRGETVGDVAHHLVDAEDLLDDENARTFAALRCREIAGKAAAIGGADRQF